MCIDAARRTYWLSLGPSVYEVLLRDEDVSVWRAYLARGHYDMALTLARRPEERVAVLRAQGAKYLAEGRMLVAAGVFAAAVGEALEHGLHA